METEKNKTNRRIKNNRPTYAKEMIERKQKKRETDPQRERQRVTERGREKERYWREGNRGHRKKEKSMREREQ